MRSLATGLLFAALCCASGLSQSVPQWQVIKVVKISGTDNIGNATLFTPSGLNQYRLTVWILAPGVKGGTAECETNVNWEESLGGVFEQRIIFISPTGPGSNYWSSDVFAISPEGGKPVTYSVICGFEHRVRLVVEELE
ncbi:MAG TPA: hypothetical protein VEI26_05100 [Terriglobales bacterium]|nr:hypothetical protein [Terriglobales bacterium]